MNKILINEGISSIVYHFCTLPVMYQISKTDSFKLSETGKYESDIRMNSFSTGKYDENGKMGRKTYPYYMCFSRTPSSMVGYQFMRITSTKNDWVNSLVRIKINGDALNARYKGAPVNFFTEKNPSGDLAKKYKYAQDWENFVAIPSRNGSPQAKRAFSKGQLVKRKMPKINPDISKRGRPALLPNGQKEVKVDYKALERNRMSEYEDRVFSNKEHILYASKYIEKIDILVSKQSLKRREVVIMISKIIQKYGTNKVFIYDNNIAFNSENISGAISKQNFKQLYYSDINKNGFDDYNSDVVFAMLDTNLYNISGIISMIAFTPDFSEDTYNKNILTICKMIGLTDFKYYGKTFNYYEEIKKRCYGFLNDFNSPTKGYKKTFPVYSMYIRNFEKRNQGKDNMMNILNKLIRIANLDAIAFSREYGDGSKMSVPLVTKLKYIKYLQWSRTKR